MSLDKLHTMLSQCEESGECWLWTGFASNKTPQVYAEGKYLQCRRLMFEAVIGPIPAGKRIVMRCREPMCLNADHMKALTNREVALLASKEGRFSTPERRAAISRARRANSKLNPEIAAAVRACATGTEAARKFGIHKSMAHRIRRGEAWAEVRGASAFTFRP